MNDYNEITLLKDIDLKICVLAKLPAYSWFSCTVSCAVTTFWAALSFLLLFAYPTPEFPTPSFEFHTAFNGVALGIVSKTNLLLPFTSLTNTNSA